MNKAELTAEVAQRLTGTDPDARQYVDTVFDTIMRHVAAGERVQILGFGTFDSVSRAARTGRNPRTGAAIQVPSGVSPRFHAGQTFRAQVTNGSPVSANSVASTAGTAVKQDSAKPAKAKKAKAADKKPGKVVTEKQAKAAVEKPAKSSEKQTAKAAAEKVAKTPAKKPADKKPGKSLKTVKVSAKKSAKAAKAGKK